MVKTKKEENVLEQKISRRRFIRKAIVCVGGLVIGGKVLNDFFINRPVYEYSKTFRRDVPKEIWKWAKEASYYDKLKQAVQCRLCPHECVLGVNDRGFCRVRVYKDHKLYTLAYGNPCSWHIDPIEKKPLYHFLPTTTAFSIATAGCNFRCLNCQNWEISQFRPEDTENADAMPETIIRAALVSRSQSIAYTYSEPSIFYEYMLDTAKLAKEWNIKNVQITNGYLNPDPLKELCKYLDAANVDLKFFTDELYKTVAAGTLEPVLNTLKILKKEGVWFEVTNLMVPTYSDDLEKVREMCKWLYKNIGPDYPLHFSRFSPEYKLTHLPPTPVRLLEDAREIAMEEGMKFVYIGNVPGHPAESTYCPNDGGLVIQRHGYAVRFMNFENGACKKCGEEIAGVWRV
jgi:pyruvate formate lyase activating enzyme